MTTHIQLLDTAVHAKIRSRYATEIDQLQNLGFSELGFYGEQLSAFSAVFLFPMVLLMRRKGEMISIQWPFRLTAWYILMAQAETGTYALPMGLGVKFYTRFRDGSGLISANFPSQAVPKKETGITKYSGARGVAEAWTLHRRALEEMTAGGREIERRTNLERFAEISRKEDDIERT